MLENGLFLRKSLARNLSEMRERGARKKWLRCNGKIETATDAELLCFINDALVLPANQLFKLSGEKFAFNFHRYFTNIVENSNPH